MQKTGFFSDARKNRIFKNEVLGPKPSALPTNDRDIRTCLRDTTSNQCQESCAAWCKRMSGSSGSSGSSGRSGSSGSSDSGSSGSGGSGRGGVRQGGEEEEEEEDGRAGGVQYEYDLAGVEYAVACFCGSSAQFELNSTKGRLDRSACAKMKCAGAKGDNKLGRSPASRFSPGGPDSGLPPRARDRRA